MATLHNEYDAIISLGGGLTPEGALLPRNYQRVDKAIELFNDGAARNIIMTGGWGFLSERPAQTEAEQNRDYAIEQGVPESAISIEDASRETIGNAVYTKQRLLVPNDWRNLKLVTSDSHVTRGEQIFGHVLGGDYNVEGVGAPEQQGFKEKAWELAGLLVLAHIINGTEAGDDAAIEQRLIDRMPGYGNVTPKQLAVNSSVGFLKHPTSVRL